MGITDLFNDMLSSLSFTEAHAEAPADDDENENKDEGGDEKEEEGGEEEGDDDKGGEDEEEDDEEEEEEEEPEDPKPKLEEECANSARCAPFKHHYDECVERVTAQSESEEHKGPKEDCVEEFFHLQHCATACAAGKLFKMLK